MASDSNQSEVARIRRQIEEEYEAMQRVYSEVSITSRHDFIVARMENVDQHRQQLVPLIGDDEAMALVIAVNDQYAPFQRSGAQQGGTNGKP